MEAFYARNDIIRKPIISPDKLVADKSPEEIVNGENYRAIDGEENLDAERQVSGDPADPDDPNNTAANQEALDNASNPNDGSLASLDEQFREGVPVRETGVLGGAVRELGSGDIGPNAAQVGSDVVSSEGIASTGFAAAKGALVITDIGDKLCRVDKALELAVKTARFLNSIKLMRAAMAFVSADDGQRRNEASSELVQELLKRVTLSDATLGNFASSSGYKFAANGSYDSGITSQKGFASTRGELSENWQDVKGVTSQVPQCGLLANPLFQVGQVAGIIALTYFTAGTGTAAAGTAAGGLRQGITTVITQITTRRALLGIAGGVILDISFDQIIAIAQLYVQQQLEVPFTGQEVGGAYSAMLFSGAGVLHKQRNLTGGFVPATSAQYSAAQDEYFNTLAAERREQSFATRMLNINNDNSLAYKSFANVAFQSVTPTDSLSDGARNIASLPSLLANSVISPIQQLTGTAYAQEANFDTLEIGGTEYATDPYGNFQTIIPAWLAEYANPEVEAENTQFLIGAGHINATTLEPTSEQFTMHMDNCVDSADTITPLEEYVEGDPSDVTKDCAATQLLTRRFKGHLINLDADDVVDAALFPEEISEGGLDAQLEVGTPTTDLDAPGLNGYAIPCSGEPTPVIRLNDPNAPYADWSQRQSSGTLSSNGTDGNPINVYIREACPGATDVKTVFIASSVHGSENGGQLISHELLYNADLPDNIRIVAVPEINKFGVTFRDNNGYGGRINGNGVNLNRNFNYRYGTIPSGAGGSNYKGTSAESEPETQALVAFVQSIDIDLALHYHDNIHYVAAVGSTTPLSLAQTYGQVSPSSPLRPAEGGRVFQRGSFDGWQNETLGTPTLLIEMAQDQSQPIIDQHVSAVQAVVSGGGF